MLTLEEIRDVQFTKTLGGYKTSEVDEFVDECVATVEALIAEKAAINEKLNVLAQKVVEYREEEDNIRTALLSAQKMGDAMMREAKLKAEEIVKEANFNAAQIERIARTEIAEEQATLERLKKEVSEFKATVIELYRQHLELLSNLPEEVKEEPAVEAEEPVAEAEPPAAKEEKEPAPIDISAEPIAEEPAPIADIEAIEDLSSGESVTEEPEIMTETPDLSMLDVEEAPAPVTPPSRNPRYNNLRFGEGYSLADDIDDEDEEDEKPRGRFKRKK